MDPNKKYALVDGDYPRVPDHLDADEIWVIGNCAARHRSFIEKSNCNGKDVPICPPHKWVIENVLRTIRTMDPDKMVELYKR